MAPNLRGGGSSPHCFNLVLQLESVPTPHGDANYAMVTGTWNIYMCCRGHLACRHFVWNIYIMLLQVILKALVTIALEVSKLQTLTGRTHPTVITWRRIRELLLLSYEEDYGSFDSFTWRRLRNFWFFHMKKITEVLLLGVCLWVG